MKHHARDVIHSWTLSIVSVNEMIIGNDIYENPVISGFMALLFREHGIRHGRSPFEPFSVQLLQQTPLDQTLGDVLIAQAKLVRLIEFKRRQNKSRKERVKLATLKIALDGAENIPLIAISREVHWFVQTDYTMEPNSVVVPYLDLEMPTGDRDLERFVEEIGEAMNGPGMSELELNSLRLYMQALAICGGEKEVGTTSGGLMISTGSTGGTRLFPIRDVRELAMTPRQVFREYDLHVKQAQMLDQRQPLQQRPDRDVRIERGPSLGL